MNQRKNVSKRNFIENVLIIMTFENQIISHMWFKENKIEFWNIKMSKYSHMTAEANRIKF